MARYTGYFAVGIGIETLREVLLELLRDCNLEITYQTRSSIISRENMGQVSVPQLVTVEVIFDTATATEIETRITLVVKNEELPLQFNNHCRQMFEVLSQSIINNRHWDLLESIAL
ncbi:MAG: hypothetical protein HC835_10870 [Oscillatoriales cyanobacterium RM2_1_1]|nr:hypothetical protein [Oscillatoriales cyanobacterium SM2_3_0]NJO46081.1 hypothetical protein [Oscillatoriales cyanobacterium RM2_1_1]